MRVPSEQEAAGEPHDCPVPPVMRALEEWPGLMSSVDHRVLLVDDQVEFLELTRALLAPGSGFDIVGTATDGETALRVAAETQPEVVLLDVQMPGWNGFETTRRLLEAQPGLRIVLISAFDDGQYAIVARTVGAIAFLTKKHLSAQRLQEILGPARSSAVG